MFQNHHGALSRSGAPHGLSATDFSNFTPADRSVEIVAMRQAQPRRAYAASLPINAGVAPIFSTSNGVVW
jgi:hypothetical protein